MSQVCHFAILTVLIKKQSLYKDMSRLFSINVKQNHIPAEYSFHDEQLIKGLHSYGLKEFYLVVHIVAILCMHTIPVNVFQELKLHNQLLLAYFGTIHPEEIIFNVHLYYHVEENIIQCRPVRQYWSFVYEHMIKQFKGCYPIMNNCKVSFGVFRRVIVMVMIELMNQINGSAMSAQPVRRIGLQCDLIVCNLPTGLERMKKEENALQWLTYSESVDDVDLLVLNAEELFVKILKVLDFDNGSALIVDDTNEMFDGDETLDE
ncbi:hypothetical protein HDU80_008251 [Chytriomyces hyalinus]|nr:hypothetical protein HDU80_008251 [Chytriomyces hyalinus]